jgi:acetyltransferase
MDHPDIESRWTLDDGVTVTVRNIQPEDSGIEQEFVRTLSPRSRYLRFFTPLKELSPAALAKFTHNSFPTRLALIATVSHGDAEKQVGVARFAPGSKTGWAEFAIAVADAWQGRGIATQLLRQLFAIAKDTGWQGIEGSVLRENSSMLILAKELGFTAVPNPDDPSLVSLSLAF